jgi:hypothetical protein
VREKKLDGKLPDGAKFDFGFYGEDAIDPGQSVPNECERPKRKAASKPKDLGL